MIYNPYTPQHPDRADEWVESAENEPEETDEDAVNKAISDWIEAGNPDAPIDWPERQGSDEQCQDIFRQVENAPLRKPLGKCVTEIAPDGTHWRL